MEKCDTVLKRCLDLEQLEIKPQSLFNAANNPALVSILINEFEMSKEAKPYYSGLSEKAEQFTPTNKKACYLKLAQYMLKQYEDKWRRRLSHARQRRLLEKIIRFLDKAGGKNAPDASADDVSLAKAKAHLYRSRLIRPKGFNVPAKKIEGLYKALDCCLASENKWCRFYAGVIALELDRCGRPSDNLFENERPGSQPANLFTLLHKATQENSIEADFWKRQDKYWDLQIEFYKMRFRLEELKLGNTDKKELFRDPFLNEKIFKHKAKALGLEKLKAAIYSGFVDKQKDLTNKLIESLREPRLPFSHVIWDDAVRFVRRLRKHKIDAWRDLAIEMWKAAETKAIETTSLRIRWYWSRQRNLYDLAFLAALDNDDVKKAAKIADSAKSKPALTWQALENLSRTDKKMKTVLKRELDYAAKALAGVYIPKLQQDDIEHPQDEFPDLSNTESIIVQFYLVHLDEEKSLDGAKNGYVLIHDNKNGGWPVNKANVKRFDFEPLFDKYINWQNTYFTVTDKKESADELEALCIELGEDLGFLLDYDKAASNRRMILIPHDFLHRVPLHGVLRKKEKESEILLERFRCSYLPAWVYANNRKMHDFKNKSQIFLPSDKNDNIFTSFWPKIQRYLDKSMFDVFYTFYNDKDKTNSSISFLCHGQADYVNPFNSKLILYPDLTLAELAFKEDLHGSTVFVSACETDLMGPLDAPLDEHLSLAQILFNRGVNSVLGTMYEFYPFAGIDNDKFASLFGNCATCKFDEIQFILTQLWEKYEKRQNNNYLYHYLCYKYYRF